MRFFSFLNDFGAYHFWAQLSHSVLLTNSAKFIMFIVVYFTYWLIYKSLFLEAFRLSLIYLAMVAVNRLNNSIKVRKVDHCFITWNYDSTSYKSRYFLEKENENICGKIITIGINTEFPVLIFLIKQHGRHGIYRQTIKKIGFIKNKQVLLKLW